MEKGLKAPQDIRNYFGSLKKEKGKEEKIEKIEKKEEVVVKIREEKCAICLDILDENKNIAKTNCKHSFCLTCLVKALKRNNQCPMCRTDIEEKNPKATRKIRFNKLMDIACDELEMFPVKDHADALSYFPGGSLRHTLKCFSVSFARGILEYQSAEGDDDDDDEDEDEDDEDDEDEDDED
jgi:hypothetical protein